jgi:PAS domain S-box-containing protein
MKYKKKISNACIYIRENVVYNVSNEFITLTGFSFGELKGNATSEIMNLLKTDSRENLGEMENDSNCYIFSKECNPMEVKISCKRNIEKNESIYFFKEIKYSRIEDNFPYLSNILPNSDIAVAIYSVPNGILLKANEKYICYLNELCNNDSIKIARALNDFIPNYKGSSYEKSFSTVLNTGMPLYYKDYNDYAYQGGNKYWDGSLVPIYRQGKLKHVLNTGVDVTERVVGRKIIEKQKAELEEQRQELEAIIENLSDEVIIFDKNGNFNIINKATRKNAIYDVEKTKNITELSKLNILYDLDGNLIPFENTLTNRVIRGEKVNSSYVVRKKDNISQIREVNGTPIYDGEGNFKFGVLIFRDINERIKQEDNFLISKQYGTLYNIIDNIDLGFARVTYPDFRLIDINHKAFSIIKKRMLIWKILSG